MRHLQGFIALTSVLVLSALFLSITISMASRAISGSYIATALVERDSAHYLAEACVEQGLFELVRTIDYNGGDSIVVGERSCEILIAPGTGVSNRELQAQATVGSHTYRTKVTLEFISPYVRITSYGRVAHY